jgi:alkanesulfonate monooxygenase SsuD/methylene tetrahydromethanopterin reductase-like flavin-dependent oxidoreductase (luciferase family)
MDVGLTLDFRNPPFRRRPWRELWEDGLWLLTEAEALGFDYVLVQEHFFTDDGYAPSMPVFLALLAERTEKIRIGSYLSVLPLHHPAHLAQEMAVLDHLCGGRLDVTVGIGHRAAEYLAFGLDQKTRPSRMEEALDVLDLAWRGEPFDYSGRYYQLEGVQVQPEPLQRPHPRLWIGATAPAAAARAARRGLHLHGANADPEFHRGYREGLVAAGHDPAERRTSNCFSITTTREDPERVWERNAELYHYRWDFYRRIRAEIGDPELRYDLPPGPDEYRVNELIGDPETVLAELEPRVRELALTDLVLFGPASGIDPRSEGIESVRLFAEEVLPSLKGG